MDEKTTEPADGSPNLVKLIRSVQRLEGNPDCFGKSEQFCDQSDCAWREYCLNKAADIHKTV